eukprot:CAMPEP_0185296884 /NCGR_PEP_ID=MMETSP1363-20130426/9426_1 /TAXON_ID=38817 /ORGANISM="Gephyrocapsa oceanica, Strain RCC1303" /LENGTH=30 /DNA_ID= /DNA_START= /DNA_END= /DNA_ORIENTATION=
MLTASPLIPPNVLRDVLQVSCCVPAASPPS